MDDAHGFHCSNMQLEQCQMVICKFITAVQYMHVLRQMRRGFCTIVLHYYMIMNIKCRSHMIISPLSVYKHFMFQSVLENTAEMASKNHSAPRLLGTCKLIDDCSRKVVQILLVTGGKVMNIL